MKKMIPAIAATMMLCGTMNINAQRFYSHHHYNKECKQDMRMHKHQRDRYYHMMRNERYRNHKDRVYVIQTIPERRTIVEYPVRRPRVVYRIHNNNRNVVAAAAAGVVIGSVLTTLTR